MSSVSDSKHRTAYEEKDAGGYDNWCAIAGFFDSDGGLDLEVRKFTLHWTLNFTDNWPPQLAEVKRFLESQGIKVGVVRPTGTGGYKVQVGEIDSLRKCATAMLEGRCLHKKRRELLALLDYFDGKITGDCVIALFNDEMRNGVRVGKLRASSLPYTYTDGRRAYKTSHKRNPLGMCALNEEDKKTVRREYLDAGSTIYQLASKYGVAPSTIFLAIRGLQRGPETQ